METDLWVLLELLVHFPVEETYLCLVLCAERSIA